MSIPTTETTKTSKLSSEPALITSTIVAVLSFAAPTIVVGDTQKALITGAVTAVLVILGGLHIRGKVTPTSVLDAVKDEAAAGLRYLEAHPDEALASITALTSGPHPMQQVPVTGYDPSIPDPQPQGTYDASVEPDPIAGRHAAPEVP